MPTILPQRKPNADRQPEERLLFPLMVAMSFILVLSLVELYALGYSFRSRDTIASLTAQDGYGVSDPRRSLQHSSGTPQRRGLPDIAR